MFKKTKTGRIIASFIALMMLAGLFAVSVCADDTLLWDTKFDGYTATDGLTVPEGWTGSRFNSNNTVKAGSDATYGTTVVIASTDALNAGVSWTGMDVGVSTASLGNRAFHLKTAIKRDTLGGFDAVLETASWRLITFGTDGNIYSGAYWGRGAFICSFTPGVWYEIDLTFVSSQKLLFGTISSSEGVKNFVTSGYENPGGSELTFGMRESGGDGFLASAGDASMAYFTAYVNDDSSLPGFEESYDFESFELGSHESNNGFYSNDTSAISIVDTGDEIHNRAVEFDLNTKTKFYAQFIRKSNGFPAFSSGKVVAEQFIIQNEIPPVVSVAGFQASLGISGAAEWVSPCLRVNIVGAPAYAHEAILAGASGFGEEVFGRTCPQFKLYKVRTKRLFKLLLNYYALIFIVLVTTLVRYKHRNRECNALCAQFFHCLCLVFIGLISVIEVGVYAVKRWHISKVYAFIGIA